MKPIETAGIAFTLLATLHASTLDLYQDRADYRLKTSETFIGFSPASLKAVCGDTEISTFASPVCKSGSHLCVLKERIDALLQKSAAARAQMKMIDTLTQRSRPQTLQAKAWLQTTEKLGNRYAALQNRADGDDLEAHGLQQLFLTQAPTMQARYLAHPCGETLQFEIPRGLIGFDLFYRADLISKKRMKIEQIAQLRNRSGVDIHVQSASLFYENVTRVLRPIDFSAWIIRQNVPVMMHPMEKSLAMAASPMASDRSRSLKARYIQPRRYRLGALRLPSNGEAVQVSVASWKTDYTKRDVVYPYRDRHVYEAVRFVPPVPIDSDRWHIVSGKRVLADRAYGKYEGSAYLLFASIDRDLIVRRRRAISKSGEHGIIFGKKMKKRDGYTIDVINRSSDQKKLRIVDRIPVSTKEEIEVKLLGVDATLPVHYALKKRGELLIDMTIPPKKSGRVDVRFEVIWPKDEPIVY